MSDTGKLTPNLDKEITKTLNLAVLQRIDPFILEILVTVSHVVFYEFNTEGSQWSRKDVEGSLFVVKRNSEPQYQFIVLNRRNASSDLRNLVENLLGDFEYEVQLPYLLYRNAAQEVNGIWFYNPHECEEVANLLTRILNPSSNVIPKSDLPSSESELKELEAVRVTSLLKRLLKRSSTASVSANCPEDTSLASYLIAAATLESSASNSANSTQTHYSSANGPLSSRNPNIFWPPSPSLLLDSLSISVTRPETPDPISSSNKVKDSIQPPSFSSLSSSTAYQHPPIFSPVATVAPSLYPPQNVQISSGTSVHQLIVPSTSPLSLAPSPATSLITINRDNVRNALLTLFQDDQFVNMFHQALLKVQHSSGY